MKDKKRMLATKSHDAMIADWMDDPLFKAEYDALADEYQSLREMLHAKKTSVPKKNTQSEN